MPRIARVCAINYPHHITQRRNNKEPVFFKEEDRGFYLKTLSKYSHKYYLEIWAYCLMSNHAHILAVPKKDESLARGIGGTNLVYTQYINRKYKRSGRLWQNRFYSTIIEKEPYLWAVARYIERNPVRAKLEKRAEGYIWSSARSHVLGKRDDILSGSWLGEKEISVYSDFFRKEDNGTETLIRKATSTGRPLGTERFIKGLEKILGRDIFAKKAGRSKRGE
ncbi:MAG TPA: transposase [Nitrospiria bacterium]|nr:transposase [Nitrospiria bacterium]